MMHVIEIGIERASNPYPFGKVEIKKREKHNKEFCLGMKSGVASTL